MNERIQELAEQAGFYVADGKIYIPSTSEEITTCQKNFAELIVRECMNAVCDPRTTYLESMTDSSAMYAARERIRKHFWINRRLKNE
jgi:hypothetical protein